MLGGAHGNVREGPSAGAARSLVLDGVRGAAALMIVWNHAYFLSGLVRPAGRVDAGSVVQQALAFGVWIFFALSGHLIAGPYLRALLTGEELPSLGRYAVKRVTRIGPAYWLAFVTAALLVGVGSVSRRQWIVHLLLAHQLVPGESEAILFVAWTLGYEAIFYVLVPTAATAIRRLRPGPIPLRQLSVGVVAAIGVGCAWAVLGAMALQVTGLHSYAAVVAWSPPFLTGFAVGMLVALATTQQAAATAGRWAWFAALGRHPRIALTVVIALDVVGTVMFIRGPLELLGLSVAIHALTGGLVLCIALWPTATTRRLLARLAPIGVVSYGVYLWHDVLLIADSRWRWAPWRNGSNEAWAAHMVLLTIASLAAGIASWYLVERPCMRFASRWLDRHTPDRAPHGATLATT